jgi:hypothetical protein
VTLLLFRGIPTRPAPGREGPTLPQIIILAEKRTRIAISACHISSEGIWPSMRRTSSNPTCGTGREANSMPARHRRPSSCEKWIDLVDQIRPRRAWPPSRSTLAKLRLGDRQFVRRLQIEPEQRAAVEMPRESRRGLGRTPRLPFRMSVTRRELGVQPDTTALAERLCAPSSRVRILPG